MMGGYLSRTTWLHRLPAGLKLLMVAGMSVRFCRFRTGDFSRFGWLS